MEDYSKFRLKKKDELAALLTGMDSLFVIACNKCFKGFTAEDEPECGEFVEFATGLGKTVAGSVIVDFLCNKPLTEKWVGAASLAKMENLFVIACGLGVQTVAELAKSRVYAACDSVSSGGGHGMALTKRRCEACGQCFLNLTGGICPIADCAKGLVNGQCGGSKGGKCETDREKDCAWAKIAERLGAQGLATGGLAAGAQTTSGQAAGAQAISTQTTDSQAGVSPQWAVQLRDYSKVSYGFLAGHVKSIRERRFEGYYGGLHISEDKGLTEHLPLVQFPIPQMVVIPLSQYDGTPEAPLVGKGDHVKTGQKIGEAGGFLGSAIHSTVSGTVLLVEPRRHSNTGREIVSVVIKSDGRDELHESVRPCADLDALSPGDIAEIVREKGIVGMGGAGFPTSAKLRPTAPIDTVLLNGCECEPLLTADHRVMLEYADDVIFGLKAIMKATGAEKGVIVIKTNKRDAVELFEGKTADIADIVVVVAWTKYPQGAEKMLIKHTLGRKMPRGGMPLDVGVVVCNVSTAKAISDALRKGLPPIERAVTVSGAKIRNPGNYMVRVGAPVREVIEHCGGLTDDGATIKLGGPMMGFVVEDLEVPILKTTNGVVAVEADISEQSQCIRCGRCADVCPLDLYPLYYPQYALNGNWAGMNEKSVNDCVECRCCDYVCSARIPITDAAKYGKRVLSGMQWRKTR